MHDEEFVIRTGDGEKRTVLVNAAPIRDAQGNITAALNSWRDITMRKQREAEIRRQNAILAGINRIFHQAMSKKSEEQLGMLCLEVVEEITQSEFGLIGEINPETRRLDNIANSNMKGLKIQGIFERVLLDGKGFFTNDPGTHPDRTDVPEGHPPLTAFLGAPLYSRGKLFGMVGLINREGGYNAETLETLERLAPAIIQALMSKRAEKGLRRSEARERQRVNEMEALMDAAPAMIWIANDPECREITGNRYAYQFMGIRQGVNISPNNPDQEDVVRTYQYMLNGKKVPASEMPLQLAASTGKPVRDHAMEIVFKDGRKFHVLGNANPLFDEIGEPRGAVGVFTDITEMRRLEAEQLKAQMDREVHHRLMGQREQERLKIARDLHDGPIQMLSSTSFYLQIMKETFPDPTLLVELNQIGINIKDTMHQLRALLYELRPPTLMHFGLAKVIQIYAEDLRERHPEIELELDVMEDQRNLPDEERLALFRIFQAGVDNIIQHAKASKVWVTFKVEPGSFYLQLRDNGSGFDGSKDFSSLLLEGHFGLLGMKERAEAIGAKFSLVSEPGAGTMITVIR